MSKESFTIIIPTFRRPLLLQKALESALGQTWSNLVVLVLDNASGGETRDVVEKQRAKDSRVHYVCHEKNIGMLGQYQYGLDHVETEFFSFLSDDDVLLPSFCEISMRGFALFPDVALFASSTIIVNQKNKIVRVPLDLWPYEGRYDPVLGASEMVGKYPVPTTVAFRKSFLKEISIDLQNPLGWDCDFLLQIAHKFPVAISKQVTGIFFNHAGSLTSDMDARDSCHSIARIIQRAIDFGWGESSKCVRLLRSDLTLLMTSRGYISEGYLVAKSNLMKNLSSLSVWFFYVSLLLLRYTPGLHLYIGVMRKIYRMCFRTKVQYGKYEQYVAKI